MPQGLVYILLILLQAGTPGDHGSAHERFAQAQREFDQARAKLAEEGNDSVEARRAFRDSAERFAVIAHDGFATANVCVNAGNAFHFAGDEPRALLWYLRARQVANTPEIRAGLAALRRVCGTELWPPPRGSVGRVLMFWHYDLGRRWKQALLLALYPAGVVLAMAGLFRRQRRWVFRGGLMLMLVGAVLGVSDVVAAHRPAEQWAVVLRQTKGYAGDGEMYSTIVDAINSGQEVRLLESRGDWRHVELPSGGRCWLPAHVCEPVHLSSADMD